MKISFKLRNELDKAGLKVVKFLHANNFQAFWVGGIVRNIMLKRESDNVDIATDALPDEIEKTLQATGIKTKPVGKQFGSILAIVDSFPIEITTFRSEGRYSDKRHPDQVQFIREYLDDAKRRDFTINALYFDPVKKELYDPANGLKDLKGKILRFVGDPKKRIDEDALRMLRGVRLATQLGFKLEKNSFAAVKTRAKYIQEISGERVKAELDKILLSENRVEGLRLLDKSGLLRFIIPQFEKLKTVQHRSKLHHLEGDVLTHTNRALELLPDNSPTELIYATLFHDTGKIIKPTKVFKDNETRFSFIGHIDLSKEIFDKFALKFRFPSKQANLTSWLIKHHDDRSPFKSWNESQQLKYLMVPNIELLLELWRVDSLANTRSIRGKLLNQVSSAYTIGKKLFGLVASKQAIIDKLARGGLIMKYTKLKPGIEVGQKIEDVKIQIVLGKIKNEKELRAYLK
ncbi:MAG: CCA tRNA nucleotidyltransferase [Candidatus Doudnabacteria bacterium]